MSEHNTYKKLTFEDKFSRKYWVNNRAKRSWIKFTKRNNNKKIRRLGKQVIKKDL